MGYTKSLLKDQGKDILFFAGLTLVLWIMAALSLKPFPFETSPFLLNYFSLLSFIGLLSLPTGFLMCFVLPSLFLDTILRLPLGSHLLMMAMQSGAIFLMRTFLKDYGFFSHWAVFALSHGLIFGFLSPNGPAQVLLTILAYPLIFRVSLVILRHLRRLKDE